MFYKKLDNGKNRCFEKFGRRKISESEGKAIQQFISGLGLALTT